MKDIAIYGAGGFGREVACLIRRINESAPEPIWNLIGFFDDGVEKGTETRYGKILGGMNEANSWPEALSVAVAIGSPKTLNKIVGKIHNPNIEFPNIIAPDTWYADKETVSIGKGNIIQGSCVFSCDVSLGDFNVLNGYVVFGHDAKVGDYNVFMPATRISGEVRIGECNLFGAQSCIIQQLKIGDGITLAAGSVLMTKPKNDGHYIGVPAKMLKF